MATSPATKRELRTLGVKLREARLRRALPQSPVAERASISRLTIKRIENGDPGVSIGSEARMMEAVFEYDDTG